MADEVGAHLHSLALKPRYKPESSPEDAERDASQDYVICAEFNPGVQIDNLSPQQWDYRARPPVPELTVFYKSGRRQTFVGRQAREFLKPIITYCEWLNDEPRERPATPPQLPLPIQ
jgi:hypothetical protein